MGRTQGRFTNTFPTSGTALADTQTRTCTAAAGPCVCVCLHRSTVFCQGTFYYAVLREPSPQGAWVISLWLLPVTASSSINVRTHAHTKL